MKASKKGMPMFQVFYSNITYSCISYEHISIGNKKMFYISFLFQNYAKTHLCLSVFLLYYFLRQRPNFSKNRTVLYQHNSVSRCDGSKPASHNPFGRTFATFV